MTIESTQHRLSFGLAWLLGALLTLVSHSLVAATCTTGFVNGITGTYYKNINFTGASATRVDSSIDFDWGTGTTGVGSLGADTFSVRWSGNLRAPATGSYQFQTTTDDGVRLWVNGVQIINNWTDHSVTTDTSASVSLVAGQSYSVVMEFYENGGYAVAKLWWNQPSDSTFTPITTQAGVTGDTSSFCVVPSVPCTSGLMGGAAGKYYNNMTLTGTAVTRNDLTIDFNWGAGASGVSGIGADNFSVRWDATLKVPVTGSYSFETISDDGVRLYVNNVLIINNWTDHSQTSNTSANVSLTAGVSYPLRMEFYENGGSAVAALHWKIPSSSSYVTVNGCPSTEAAYTISHSGTGITCAGEPITFTAVDSAGSAVAPTAGTQVTLSTTPGTGTWVGGNTYSFTGSESSFVKYLQQLTAGTLNLSITDGTYSELASSDPPITFVTAALKFYGNSAGTLAIPNEISGQLDSAPVLRAIRTDNNTGACVAQVTGTRAVNLAYVCRNPTTCVSGQSLSMNGVSVQSNPNSSLANPTYSGVNLTFDATGTASIPLNYSDAGQLRLFAQLPLAASGNNPAISLSGASNDFVVKPYALAVSAVQNSAGVANPATTTSGAGFVSAGTPFKVYVQPRNFLGNPTPNFGNETPSELTNLALTASSLVYPTIASAQLTPLSNPSVFTATTPAGTFVNTTINWNQVGTIVITPGLADSDYLGAGNIGVIINSGNVGRFYPDHYRLVSSSLSNACGSFTYMGQPMALNYVLQAESLGGTVLTNYFAGNNSYATQANIAAPSYVAEDNDSGNGAALSPRVSVGSTSWVSGVLTVASPSITTAFNRQLITGAPDGPFTSLQLGMDVVDSFDSRSLQGKNMNPTTTGNCTINCTAVAFGAPTALALRWGRLRLDNAFGPESVQLPVNFVTEYWTGNIFNINGSDSCTLVPRAAITYNWGASSGGALTTNANRTVALSSGTTTGNYNNIDPASSGGVHFNAGNAGQYFTAPSSSGSGSWVIKTDLTNLSWLTYDWNQDGNYSDVKLPDANFSFGSYRGNDRIIYWREKL